MNNRLPRSEKEILELRIKAAKTLLQNPFPTEITKKTIRKNLESDEAKLKALLASEEMVTSE